MEALLSEFHKTETDKKSIGRMVTPSVPLSLPLELTRHKKGTTTLAMIIKEGIVVAVDSRATRGAFISSQSVQKYIPITSHIVGTMAGGAADCSYWERELTRRCRLFELRNRPPISVAAASKIFANILYHYKNYDLSVGSMISGFDKTGPHIYYVEDGGVRIPGNIFSVGSGSPFAVSVIDTEYDYNMGKEKAIELARRAIFHATHRDVASGGNVNVLFIDQNGWKLISRNDCYDLYYDRFNIEEYQKHKPMDED
ncbi:proteasome subunit beta type-5 precursor, putative [Entamoeba invadens IP1]|uniref:proteasome subunit beta type-5 precursor, putative n=1 Tax=Entamoeba invadens IP1 TaxID=370355 RepID=UPI0002C3D6CA|nr:proteasome subunit beta type-5 precursor, putative [Entamoeba invadens IP1]ELP93858.1 proteasome subunit beta type-5 precursor, putative [Entamoeba invadens IP1]|eukprot:XP_004260629.1 proteasome subunit beta type-5 precursor, putative [Entamoeba invadens IP1]